MLRRTVLGNGRFVCLQCRLRLSGSVATRRPFATPTLTTIPTPRGRRHFVTSTSTRSGNASAAEGGDGTDATSAANPWDGEQTSERTSDPFARSTEEVVIRRILSHDIPLSEDVERRTYMTRGMRVKPMNETLDIGIMGEPGTSLVLREHGKWLEYGAAREPEYQYRGVPGISDDGDDTGKLAEILTQALEKENDNLTLGDVIRNLNELRPSETQILSKNNIEALEYSITTCFTKIQLAAYLQHYEKVQRLNDESRLLNGSPWVLERRLWTPKAAQENTGNGKTGQDSVPTSMSSKKKLAHWIVHYCWRVYTQETVEGLGYLELKLRDIEFGLLLAGAKKWLASISAAFKHPGKQIELIRPDNWVSILAPRRPAELMVAEISKVLDRARTVSLDARLVSAEPIDPAIMDEVGRITNTAVQFDSSTNQITVSWVHDPERGEELESPVDVVLRFLLQVYYSAPSSSNALAVIPKRNPNGGRYIVEFGCDTKLPWQNRIRKWARWATAAYQNQHYRPIKEKIRPKHIPFPIKVMSAPKPMVQENKSKSVTRHIDSGWPQSAEISTKAIFGHVLSALPRGFLTTTTRPLMDTSLPRTFLPTLPPLQTLDLPTNWRQRGQWPGMLVLRFIPSPYQSPEIRATAPPLELLVEHDNDRATRPVALRAVTGTSVFDALLPGRPVDVRFFQQHYFNLPSTSFKQHAEPVLDFLAGAELEPWAGKLVTPSNLNGLRIPRRLLAPAPSAVTTADTSAETEQAKDKGDADLVSVDYLFAALEMMNTITSDHMGFKLVYKSVEAGQRGGKRAEVSLHAVAVPTPKRQPKSQAKEDTAVFEMPIDVYLSTVSGLARGADRGACVLQWEVQEAAVHTKDM
ncbi:mitochondrial inner-membrane-bound regulator-domain-containing protein [Lasiosphaeria miniovina]|uniref:Mitochondrial inner-membrane-bound regulator-domain-containing protein n=1 Tax=Lasiosphaeria miniovina TaxID=1954250 RepID=A0AA40BGA0_9PEZI|nr:mitochondrial inner-membrane-bound regulator-domain-containing protein [Lasiosphaeria miniovina]KAK0733696.1 mitochondrial inner-membrane-bound regulator-domain-containing protein [Lasiosphaeria miniovina]